MARFAASSTVLGALLFCSTFLSMVSATTYITGMNAAGEVQELANDRNPALYTGDFGDCLGGQSLLNVTQFDAAYYADNLTILFHIGGATNLRNDTVMLYISVDAYGEDRFDKIFDPCQANIKSLCPMRAGVPIYAEAIIPVGIPDVANIIPIALVIPDFEGSATLRIYSNSTKTEIGCFRAVMRNNSSFSHPAAVGSVLGFFTFVAVIASFATAIYGINMPAMRTHYAHSLSVLVIFETFHSIFFSGALSLNWPSVCAAWWSNFAWSAGMISSSAITNSINKFVGNFGNSSQVGGAGSSIINNNGGLQQIYGRSLFEETGVLDLVTRGEELLDVLSKRDDSNNATGRGYSWNGNPVSPGMALPGNWSSFAGELGVVGIPVTNAFLNGFIWFLILLVTLVGATVAFKWLLEGLSAIKWIKQDRLALFRHNWLYFTGLVVLRMMIIGFFMIMTLALFQFSIDGGPAITALTAVIFAVFFVSTLGIAGYACFCRLHFGRYESSPDRVLFQRKILLKAVPWFETVRESNLSNEEKASGKYAGSVPFFRVRYIDHDAERQSVHQDQAYIKRFGWLTAHFRRTRWWFFAFWVVYQFIRACFIGGSRTNAMAAVFSLLVFEIIAFIAIAWINPFEGSRNTALAVYMLGISKVATVGLSVAFLPQYNLQRIPTTVIGVIIIVIQGFLTIAVLILIVLSAISSWFSLTRNQEEFKPQRLEGIRLKYFDRLEKKAPDVPPPPPPMPEEPKEPYFSVNKVRRAPKIEDEEVDFVAEMPLGEAANQSLPGRNSTRASRSNSVQSNMSGFGNAPYGARVHRQSWSSRDFSSWQDAMPGESPQRSASRQANIKHLSNSGASTMSVAPLIRPQLSTSNLRPSTPTRHQQSQHTSQRFASAK